MSKKAEVTVPKRQYDAAMAAVAAGVVLLDAMEKAGALRLPFPNYPATIAQMKALVKK